MRMQAMPIVDLLLDDSTAKERIRLNPVLLKSRAMHW